MLESLLWSAAIAVGFLLLNQGAKFITDNATWVSRKIARSRFVVGALFVSTLSAVPELLVSGIAAEEGSPDLALGNALASTIVTIALVIGVSALFRHPQHSREIVLRDAVFLAIVTLVAATLLLDGNLTRFEGFALASLFVPYVMNLSISQRTGPAEEIAERMKEMTIGLAFTGWIFGRKIGVRAGITWLVFGVLWSVMGAQFLVRGAIGLSAIAGMSPWLVGITVVAMGTSLPDIAVAYHATRQGYTDLVLGAGIGAGVVTTLLTLGTIGILTPSNHSVAMLLPVVGVLVFIAFLLVALLLGGGKITSRAGAALDATDRAMVAWLPTRRLVRRAEQERSPHPRRDSGV
jgi:cation:H+ antiporter